MDAETILHELDESGAYERKSDGYWAAWPGLEVRAMAELMRAQGARLVTLTALPDSAGGFHVIYHWDVDSTLVNISTTAASGSIPTIADILPAADWAEREIRDYYAIEFEGRGETPTLMLREGDEPGLFSRTCDLGTDTDPAEIARAAWDAAEAGEL
jgi:NADH:ubiquinone oxidoreductase subunit C